METMGILEKLESLRKQVETLDSSEPAPANVMIELPRELFLLIIKVAEAYYTEKE